MKKLNLEFIQSLQDLKTRSYKSDWDDTALEVILKNGITLTGYTQLNNSPVKTDSLEGLSGYLYIQTEEDLVKFNNMSYDELLKHIKDNNSEFSIEDYENGEYD